MSRQGRFPSFRRTGALLLRALAVPLVLLLPVDAAGQAAHGTLLGNVRDDSGAAVPGATVTATETRTNISRSTVSNETGYYIFTNVPPGTYRIDGELSGFKKFTRDGVELRVNTSVRVDIGLSVGALTESVTVTAETPTLQTDRTDTGRIIEGAQIAEMPLGFNRNFQGMLITVPGASRPFRPHSEFFNSQDSLSSNVNGQSRLANNVQLEGTDNNHKTGLLTVLIPSAEALETVAVTTSNYDAEFGRAGGAVTNVTLKSGTNDLSGTGFVFGNSEATVARNPFSALSEPPDTKYLQGGFTLGGPILRNRLFFFGDYVRTIDDSGRITRADLPEAAFRNGDFSAASTIIYDPATGNPDGTGRTPFPNNQIPADRISPIAQTIMANVPLPNLSGIPLGGTNYEKPYVREKRTNQFDFKVTSQMTAADNLSVRYSYTNPTTYDPATFGIWGGIKGFAGYGTNPTHNVAGNYNKAWSNTLIQEVRVGMSYYHNEAISEAHGQNTSEEVGISGINLNPFSSGITTIDVAGYNGTLVGFAASLPWDRSERTWTIATTATKLWGNHTLKVGGDLRYNRDYLLQVQDNGGPRGIFRYRGATTATPSDTAAQNGFANAFAAFLLDAPQSLGRDLITDVDPGTRHWAVFTYIHDKWQIRPDITLDLGLRHEYYTPLVGLTGRGGLSNYDPTNNTLRVSGYSQVPDNLGVESYWWNFNPRTGISWRLNEFNVLRAGYGVSTIPWPDNSYAFNFPVKQNNQINPPNSFATAGSMAAGMPDPNFAVIPETGVVPGAPFNQQGFFSVPTDLHEGRLHSWNVAYQRELPGGFTAEVAYVANRGQDIIARIDLNAGYTLGADNAGRPLFAEFGRSASTTSTMPVKSTYHSMQVKVDRRLRSGLQMTNSYTLGRGYNYYNGDSNGTISTPADIERSWGRTSFDSTHSFTSSFVYILPWGPQGRWLQEGVLGRIFGDWQVSGIFAAISGTPIDFTASAAGLRAPGNTQRPNASGTPDVLGGIGTDQLWFDTSVFSAPEAGTWGNVRRNMLLTGPAYVNLDASLVKIVRIGTRRAELRADFFNATNSPHYSNPNGSFGNANFGRITSIIGGTERVIRFGARFLF
ncbi:MAG TPA: carboxypeptidase regulatory-like domain-containing protein [Vicinamibacterales bacterium]|nr:carboxypeptidase regulatory-like domain-containing protein [Vicinamibacterales bacterium]